MQHGGALTSRLVSHCIAWQDEHTSKAVACVLLRHAAGGRRRAPIQPVLACMRVPAWLLAGLRGVSSYNSKFFLWSCGHNVHMHRRPCKPGSPFAHDTRRCTANALDALPAVAWRAAWPCGRRPHTLRRWPCGRRRPGALHTLRIARAKAHAADGPAHALQRVPATTLAIMALPCAGPACVIDHHCGPWYGHPPIQNASIRACRAEAARSSGMYVCVRRAAKPPPQPALSDAARHRMGPARRDAAHPCVRSIVSRRVVWVHGAAAAAAWRGRVHVRLKRAAAAPGLWPAGGHISGLHARAWRFTASAAAVAPIAAAAMREEGSSRSACMNVLQTQSKHACSGTLMQASGTG